MTALQDALKNKGKETPVTPDKTPELKYQHYSCSRQAMRMISTGGRKITFVGYQYLTCEQEIIDYLDNEIAQGLRVITKGDLLTSKEADPLEKLKEKHIAEYLATQRAAQKGDADMGNTKTPEQLLASLKPLATAGVANSGPSDS